MIEWKEESGVLEIRKKQKQGLGCATFFLRTIGFLLLTVSFLYVYSSVSRGLFDFYVVIAMVVMAFGLLLLFGVRLQAGLGYNLVTRLDNHKKEVQFFRNNPEGACKFSYGELRDICLLKIVKVKSSSEPLRSSTYNTFQIFLRKKDGALFWLATYLKREELSEPVEQLYEFLGLEVFDKTGADLSRQAREDFSDLHSERPLGPPSRFIKVTQHPEGLIFSLNTKKTFRESVVAFSLCFIFLAIPFGIFATPVMIAISNPTLGNLALGIPFGLIGLALCSLIVVFMLSTLRTFEVQVRADKLVVWVRFPLAIIEKYMGKEAEIYRDNLRHVQVNRVENGHFWLTLDVREKVDVEPSLFMETTVFCKENFEGLGRENIIGLWSVFDSDNQSAITYSDLYFLESKIQDVMNLDDFVSTES